MANIGHVIALLRENRHLIGAGQSVHVYVEGHGHQRWGLDHTPGDDPIISQLLAEAAEGAEHGGQRPTEANRPKEETWFTHS